MDSRVAFVIWGPHFRNVGSGFQNLSPTLKQPPYAVYGLGFRVIGILRNPKVLRVRVRSKLSPKELKRAPHLESLGKCGFRTSTQEGYPTCQPACS